ncbi:DEAD/DEAH box helicase [Rhizobium lentis]|uniref:DEAD/DEAH box helicase n=1 Tax=Rhizobium lentis TaxID=1138194 RepID=UPI001C82B523|nr:DEAD/DEAH box helicase [Rhizobium lentis]MBX5154021.1 DEAD/DEAH box helicase [Rhizobium lentis]
MSQGDLLRWLLQEGVADDLAVLVRWTVASEIDNLTVPISEMAAVDTIDWERMLLAASMFARSDERPYQEAGLRIATAALTLDTPPKVKDAAAVVLDKLSNHRAIALALERNHLRPEWEKRLGVSLRLETTRRSLSNSVLLESTGQRLQVNGFQKKFWEGAANSLAWTSVSAPTASGKTFLVIQWLIDRVRRTKSNIVVYLAPTRALVTEIEDSLTAMIKSLALQGIDVTSLPLKERYEAAASAGSNLIFVFTQERLHLLANILEDTIHVDLLVVDEAHKIGDNQRGVVLQDALERASRANPQMRVVFISPATQNPGELLDDAPDEVERIPIVSDVPTVLQNIVVAEQVPRKPKQWNLKLRRGSQEDHLGILELSSTPSGVTKRVAFIAAAAGKRGGTLVYANGAAKAEEIAGLIGQFCPKPLEVDPELAALADLARKGVHRNYQLAPLVELGVAFHYGNMPSLIRVEIERLFKSGKIKFLICTSTLIEGVNLACRTIVVRGPRKGVGKPMEPHDFWNLAGRAGRWGDEFQGNVICINPGDTDAWPGGVPERARYPIKRETDAVLADAGRVAEFLSTRLSVDTATLEDNSQLEQVSAYLLTTYLRLGSITSAPFAKRHLEDGLNQITEQLAVLGANIRIPNVLAIRHPGVSPAGMQRLLDAFEAYSDDVEDLLLAPPQSSDAYERLVLAMELVSTHLYPAFMPIKRIPLYVTIVLEWLHGYSLSTMIRKRIDYNRDHNITQTLPALIRETMELVEQIARFRAPKYLSAYVEVLNFHLKAIGRPDLIDNELDLGVALEFGVSSRTLLSLMELGLSRMSAVALFEKIVRDDLDKAACIDWVRIRENQLENLELPTIILNEVRAKLLGTTTVQSQNSG